MGRLEHEFKWREKGVTGSIKINVEAQHGKGRYSCPWHPWDCVAACEEAARCSAFSLRARVAFIDVTGAKLSKKRLDTFPGIGVSSYSIPSGFDHWKVWRLPDGEFLISNEPYPSNLNEAKWTCKQAGWEYFMMPVGVGMWNPHPLHGTRLMLIVPGELSRKLAETIDLLKVRMPVAEEDYVGVDP